MPSDWYPAKKELKYFSVKDLRHNDILNILEELKDEDTVTVHPDGHVYKDLSGPYIGDLIVDDIDFSRTEIDSNGHGCNDVYATCPKCRVLVGTVWRSRESGRLYWVAAHDSMGNKSYDDDTEIGPDCPKCKDLFGGAKLYVVQTEKYPHKELGNFSGDTPSEAIEKAKGTFEEFADHTLQAYPLGVYR